MSDVIRLLDSAKGKVLDSVSVDYEDSFCLESFGDLAKAFDEEEGPKGPKRFIIARVQTWDCKQPEKAFYSYYHAFHLNKILFQTQVYLGKKLIHRLHVLNPLTNTDIIGSVQYFMVKRKDDSAIIPNNNGSLQDTNIIGSKIQEEPVDAPALKAAPGLAKQEDGVVPDSSADNIATQDSSTPRPKLKIDTQKAATVKDRGRASASIIEVESKSVQKWTLAQPAVTIDEESPEADAKQKPILRRISFQRPKQKRTSSASKSNDRKHHPAGPTSPIRTEQIQIPFTPLSAPPGPIPPPTTYENREVGVVRATSVPKGSGGGYLADVNDNLYTHEGRRHTAINIVMRPAEGPLVLGINQNLKIQVLPGQITRFAIPVPQSEIGNIAPPTTYTRRRALSYANAVTAAGTKATMKEWIEMVKLDKESSPGGDQKCKGNYDQVKPFGTPSIKSFSSSPMKKTPDMPTLPEGRIEEEDEEEAAIDSEKAQSEDIQEIVWDAVLFATDTDFLESSRTRLKFKENALVPEDAMLFKMKEYTGEEPAPPQTEVILEDQIFFLDCCYPTPEQLENSSPFMKMFHHFKCYLLAMLLMIGVFAFIFFTLQSQNSTNVR